MSSSRSLRLWPRRCTTPHEDRGRPGPGGGERDEVHGQVPDDSSSPAGALQSVRRRARRRAACQPGTAAGAAGADPAAHRGAACRNSSHGADPRRSCAADTGLAARRARLTTVPEQVIEVPKNLLEDVHFRAVLRDPQLAEQLVEVSTIVSYSWLQLRM